MPDEREDRWEGEQCDRPKHPQCLLKATGESGGWCVAGVTQGVGVAGGDA